MSAKTAIKKEDYDIGYAAGRVGFPPLAFPEMMHYHGISYRAGFMDGRRVWKSEQNRDGGSE